MFDLARCNGPVARVAAALVLAVLGGCSGAVSGPPATVTPGPISVTPATATMYSELPTTFIVTGGNGSYIVSSSDQSIIPTVGPVAASSIVLVPNQVAVDTPVTLTVRDTGTTTPVNAAVTVKPRTVSNVVTVTPSASQSAECGAAVCAGGDAEVRVALSRNGVPLQGQEVRFDVVSGDFRIITSPAGAPEALSLSGTTFTDAAGIARMRIRVLNNAGAQTGLLAITDVNSGSSTRTSVSIAPSSNAPLSAQPEAISFTGSTNTTCASGIAADVIVFGGRPPYQISQPGTFLVSPTQVLQSGGRFTVTATGQCTVSSPIAIVDSNGASVTVNASNQTGTGVGTTLVVSPQTVTLENCQSVASVAIAGGTPPYFAASSSNTVLVTMTSGSSGGWIATIRRANNTGVAPATVGVGISDGTRVAQVTVTLGVGAQGPCAI